MFPLGQETIKPSEGGSVMGIWVQCRVLFNVLMSSMSHCKQRQHKQS